MMRLIEGTEKRIEDSENCYEVWVDIIFTKFYYSSTNHPGKDEHVNTCRDMKTFANAKDGSNLNDVSPILTYIDTLNVVLNEDCSKYFKILSLKQLRQETDVDEDGFGFAVSLRDGTCLYTSKGMSKHLGFPKNMLDGQSFKKFLNLRDHVTFANHLSQVLNVCFVQGNRNDSHLASNTFFCRMRRYHSLKDGYAISDRTTAYKPFRIQLHINELLVDDMCVDDLTGTLCVNATASVITSGYSAPEEIPLMSAFTTRHTSSCHFSHVDGSAIPYIGYLPQDLIGLSIFDFYHIDDMPQLKDIYELVAKERGSSFLSKPYRFKIQNGCYISLETEWSCFISPVTHKLEFVIGQHRVLKGPTDLDIFNSPKKPDDYFPEEIIKEGLKIQEEIIVLLTSRTYLPGYEQPKRFASKRKRGLLNFVYNSFATDDDDTNEAKQKCKGVTKDDSSTSDTDTVGMGDISPYREVSSVASDTPPTVQNFRLQENLERFFASKPKTYSKGSDDFNKNEKVSGDGNHSQSSSGSGSGNSGNGSGNTSVQTSASKCNRNSPANSSNNSNNSNNNEQQESSSSKCHFSNYSDSGYGKSFSNSGNKDGQGTTSQMGSKTMEWNGSKTVEQWNGNKTMEWQDGHRTEGEETFYSCLALPEHSLSKRNSHKHFKKEMQATSTDNWLQQQDFQQQDFQQQDFCQCNKPTQPRQSTLTQTDCIWNGMTNPCMFHQPQHSCGLVSNSCAPVPKQFYVPVMYMPQQNQNSQCSCGAHTTNPQAQYSFGPTTTNPQAQCSFGGPINNPQTHCSFGATCTNPQAQYSFGAPTTNPQAQCSIGGHTTNPQAHCSFGGHITNHQAQWSSGVQPTNTSNPGQSGEIAGYHSYQNSENLHRPSEEFRAPPTPCKTTMEPSRDFSGSYENQREEKYDDQNTYYGKMMENFTEAVDGQMQKRSVEQVEEMQGEVSPSISFLSRSSSYDKDEDMVNDKENPSVRPNSSKVDLSSESAYRYRMHIPNIEDTLRKDREVLKSMTQPEMVNCQLLQLQEEREQENKCKINLGEDNCNITEAIMLGLAMDDCVNDYEHHFEKCSQNSSFQPSWCPRNFRPFISEKQVTFLQNKKCL
ncbi:hypothetical protein JTE90_004880 [Oedothorax gibbosus]|uniref:Period circadian protein n=1 Tax=Oedothorax gibbosus TaxID=931172 RepID=A0AAV6UTK8_9ARAC|nr:hypothetical protein JTE90_004880 [Oedothorax gibbosus]